MSTDTNPEADLNDAIPLELDPIADAALEYAQHFGPSAYPMPSQEGADAMNTDCDKLDGPLVCPDCGTPTTLWCRKYAKPMSLICPRCRPEYVEDDLVEQWLAGEKSIEAKLGTIRPRIDLAVRVNGADPVEVHLYQQTIDGQRKVLLATVMLDDRCRTVAHAMRLAVHRTICHSRWVEP